MNDQKHTEEPWFDHGCFNQDEVTLSPADYKRAMECVNAMAGIEDPENFMANIKSMLQWSVAIEEGEVELDNSNYVRELEKALDLFPKEKK